MFLATVSPTNGRGPRCTEADQAGIEAPVLSLQLDDPLEEEDKVWDTLSHGRSGFDSDEHSRGFEPSACRRPGTEARFIIRSRGHV